MKIGLSFTNLYFLIGISIKSEGNNKQGKNENLTSKEKNKTMPNSKATRGNIDATLEVIE
ncbi:hypothetical protein [Neobacillus sp. NPDC093127]|uniref:hypothetical protein n=1 Tax=Neobacillus sp. NPDC093127 TaxID=3364296 RepID=UPI00382A5F8E